MAPPVPTLIIGGSGAEIRSGAMTTPTGNAGADQFRYEQQQYGYDHHYSDNTDKIGFGGAGPGAELPTTGRTAAAQRRFAKPTFGRAEFHQLVINNNDDNHVM
jgi:hypothetical protein